MPRAAAPRTPSETPTGAAMGLAERLGRKDASPTLARKAQADFAKAPTLVRSQVVLLAKAGWPAAVAVFEPPEDQGLAPLPFSIAMATLASTADIDWLGVDAAEASAFAKGVLRKLAACGYRTEGVTRRQVFGSLWLTTEPDPVAAAAPLMRRADALAEVAARALSDKEAEVRGKEAVRLMDLSRGLVASVWRRVLHERHGLIAPEDIARAIEGLTYAQITAATGAHAPSISGWIRGQRRVADDAALWLLRRLESREEESREGQ